VGILSSSSQNKQKQHNKKQGRDHRKPDAAIPSFNHYLELDRMNGSINQA
jgi:hypothetical protein